MTESDHSETESCSAMKAEEESNSTDDSDSTDDDNKMILKTMKPFNYGTRNLG